MSLDSLLTTTRLRTLAGSSYQRGVKYCEQGHVVECVREGETLKGVVEGTETYTVQVAAHGRSLTSSCTCPVDYEMCKHAVALALRYLADLEPARPVKGASTEPVFATTRELEAWARAHEVMHELSVSAEELLPELAGVYDPTALRYMLVRVSLREIGSLEGSARFVGVRALQRPAAIAVARRLERAASDVQAAIAEEAAQTLVPRSPRSRRCGRSSASCVARSARRRRRGRARCGRRARSTSSPRPTSLVWKEPTKIALVRQTFALAPVTTRLAFAPEPRITCACQAPACTHALALLDAALELLADPAQVRHAADRRGGAQAAVAARARRARGRRAAGGEAARADRGVVADRSSSLDARADRQEGSSSAAA